LRDARGIIEEKTGGREKHPIRTMTEFSEGEIRKTFRSHPPHQGIQALPARACAVWVYKRADRIVRYRCVERNVNQLDASLQPQKTLQNGEVGNGGIYSSAPSLLDLKMVPVKLTSRSRNGKSRQEINQKEHPGRETVRVRGKEANSKNGDQFSHQISSFSFSFRREASKKN